MEIEHCSHPHHLIQCSNKNGVPCSGCVRPLSGRVYGCPSCDFFLHESCSKLPSEIKHPFHPDHALTLLPRIPLDAMPVRFWCDACWQTCRGFTFRCPDCAFNLDACCAQLMPTVKSELHHHPLAFFKELSLDINCNHCHAICNASVLRCVHCSVNFHIRCATTLPLAIQMACHRHSLHLTESLVEDELGELYCDACEEPRIPNQIVYHCEECEFTAHVYCAVSEVLPTLFKLATEQDQIGMSLDPILAQFDKEIRVLRLESATQAGKLAEVRRKLKELHEKRLELVEEGKRLIQTATKHS